MERVYAGMRAPIPPVRLPAGTTPSAAMQSLKLRLLSPDGASRAVVPPNVLIERDPSDALVWSYTGTVSDAGVWQWQWEFERAVVAYGTFRVRATGFSG